MTNTDLLHNAEKLEKQIEAADFTARVALQPAFSRVLDQMRFAGISVPLRMKRLDDTLCDEIMERNFDNLPV